MDGNTDLGYANVTGTSFSIALNLPAGANQLEVTADDAAGNVSPSSTFNVFVDETPPQISSVAGRHSEPEEYPGRARSTSRSPSRSTRPRSRPPT